MVALLEVRPKEGWFSRMMPSRGMGKIKKMASGGQPKSKSKSKSKSKVNEAGNYTKPGLRKRIFNSIKAGGKGGAPGQWSARKAQMLAKRYKEAGGGYKS